MPNIRISSSFNSAQSPAASDLIQKTAEQIKDEKKDLQKDAIDKFKKVIGEEFTPNGINARNLKSFISNANESIKVSYNLSTEERKELLKKIGEVKNSIEKKNRDGKIRKFLQSTFGKSVYLSKKDQLHFTREMNLLTKDLKGYEILFNHPEEIKRTINAIYKPIQELADNEANFHKNLSFLLELRKELLSEGTITAGSEEDCLLFENVQEIHDKSKIIHQKLSELKSELDKKRQENNLVDFNKIAKKSLESTFAPEFMREYFLLFDRPVINYEKAYNMIKNHQSLQKQIDTFNNKNAKALSYGDVEGLLKNIFQRNMRYPLTLAEISKNLPLITTSVENITYNTNLVNEQRRAYESYEHAIQTKFNKKNPILSQVHSFVGLAKNAESLRSIKSTECENLLNKINEAEAQLAGRHIGEKIKRVAMLGKTTSNQKKREYHLRQLDSLKKDLTLKKESLDEAKPITIPANTSNTLPSDTLQGIRLSRSQHTSLKSMPLPPPPVPVRKILPIQRPKDVEPKESPGQAKAAPSSPAFLGKIRAKRKSENSMQKLSQEQLQAQLKKVSEQITAQQKIIKEYQKTINTINKDDGFRRILLPGYNKPLLTIQKENLKAYQEAKKSHETAQQKLKELKQLQAELNQQIQIMHPQQNAQGSIIEQQVQSNSKPPISPPPAVPIPKSREAKIAVKKPTADALAQKGQNLKKVEKKEPKKTVNENIPMPFNTKMLNQIVHSVKADGKDEEWK